MKYSIVIPVYNRPEEVDELLESLSKQTFRDFEVIIVEDGSNKPCKEICDKYADRMPVRYLMKENGGPSLARNLGVKNAQGEWAIVLDSDCVLPETYLEEVQKGLASEDIDAFGGPDKAGSGFSDVQKAISYSMTSFFTTGGIRGGKKKLDKFYPRSFNMGIKRSVYEALNGFNPDLRFGEDIDFSLRIFEGGFKCRLIPEAWVWHKRRTDFKKFFRQVVNSGIARINLSILHPGSLKLVHLFPACFTVSVPLLLILSIWKWWLLLPVFLYALLVFWGATIKEKSRFVGFLAIAAAFVQLGGYGMGFLWAWWNRMVMKHHNFSAYNKTFYK